MKTVYQKPTKRVRRPTQEESDCAHQNPLMPFFECERVKGHKGSHMAWDGYELGRLYPVNGVWKS